LIIDDSEFIVHRLMMALGRVKGIEIVGQAGTVQKATAAIRRLAPDVVILDIALPGGSGLDVLESMRKEGSKSLVIVLTNHPYAAYRRRCARLGCDFFFDKSKEFERVGEVLEGLLQAASPEGVESPQEMDFAGACGRGKRLIEYTPPANSSSPWAELLKA
jgi:DNA-binding NarL/FixJ family response regulator